MKENKKKRVDEEVIEIREILERKSFKTIDKNRKQIEIKNWNLVVNVSNNLSVIYFELFLFFFEFSSNVVCV